MPRVPGVLVPLRPLALLALDREVIPGFNGGLAPCWERPAATLSMGVAVDLTVDMPSDIWVRIMARLEPLMKELAADILDLDELSC
eukprot:scaffold673195_cov42-Prasinocladus_malaysianus.AAC.2